MGVFSLKFELTEFLLNYGGHIGYAARPSERNRGLATQTLLLIGFGVIYNGDIIFCVTYRRIGSCGGKAFENCYNLWKYEI